MPLIENDFRYKRHCAGSAYRKETFIPVSYTHLDVYKRQSLYSLTQVLLAAGALCGGILAGILAPKLSLRNMHWVLLLASLCLLPIGISLDVYKRQKSS